MTQISPRSEDEQKCTVILELVTDPNDHDPALLSAIGHEVVHLAQAEGYTTRPAPYTGERGIESFLVELVTFIAANHATIAEGIADISGLLTVCTSLVPLLKRTKEAHTQQVGPTGQHDSSIKLTIEIDGKPLVIEAADLTQADAVLKLALKYRALYPTTATQVTPNSTIKVQGQMHARKRRRRR
ncbi:hypothetical protein KSF_049450 [Reticulibacter mediterranei]|uniref:Uncharacterized protein n=1 Tax=Reticulibacter mediterranei TaxID=2778369 RepID=A0A8J3N215_9CHLR|nr:hypothetical protein [Reticulibacter mediterranei]GHO94897.1 hypothetical protein KSF_049450 [Reticulibacter mediterranei]